ncbi:MAG: dTDP-4-dehydrorhamnose reductase [Bacteroidales bacterium]|nr:dTDP-4-dehydrorhamnose reductase [Bacteroidales bacterium]
MYRILVTGSKGQLGSEIRELTKNERSGNYLYTDVTELDITDKSAVNRFVADHQIDIIINCAAYTNVDKAEDDEEAALQINGTAPGNLADAILSIINNGLFQNQKEIYHYSNEGVCSWFDFAIAINELFGNDCHIKPCHSDEFPTKVTRPHFSVLDKAKIKRDRGLEIPYWRNSLKSCIDLLR